MSTGRELHRNNILLSPLRYPGSKRQLVELVQDYIESASRPVELFVEPFAGGASVSLQLAAWGSVGSILIADRDPLVYSFWKTAAYDSEWLIDEMNEIEVSVPMWEKMVSSEPRTVRERALKCLFLNRTSFSGILHRQAGPIGGKTQRSKYSIDCRFPKATIAKRIRQVASLAEEGRIAAVWPYDYRETITHVREERGRSSVFIFMDPPFFAKAGKLYQHSFRMDDHKELARFIGRMRFPFVLSYDNHPDVRRLYNGGRRLELVEMSYRASAGSSSTTEELIVTNIRTEDVDDD